jgi:dUTP pyrophosphatase
MEVELRVLDARLHEWGLPSYQSAHAAAVDLHACLDAPLEIAPGASAVLISSGIAIHIADPGSPRWCCRAPVLAIARASCSVISSA